VSFAILTAVGILVQIGGMDAAASCRVVACKLLILKWRRERDSILEASIEAASCGFDIAGSAVVADGGIRTFEVQSGSITCRALLAEDRLATSGACVDLTICAGKTGVIEENRIAQGH
jgi:hypothetical protein